MALIAAFTLILFVSFPRSSDAVCQWFDDQGQTYITDYPRPQIRSLIGQKQNVMVVVGTVHFAGADGIIAELKLKVYRTEQP